MRLTTYTDYSLRVLIFLGLKHHTNKDDLSTIAEIAKAYAISENHLMKAVHNLALGDWIESIRGRNGGIRLKRSPDKIIIGEVVRTTEENFNMTECFDKETNHCVITASCELKNLLHNALNAYLTVLDNATLDDMLTTPAATANQLGLNVGTVQTLSAVIPRKKSKSKNL